MLRKLQSAPDRDTKDIVNKALWQLSKAERTFERIALYGDVDETLSARLTPIALGAFSENLFNALSPEARASVELTDLGVLPNVRGELLST